MIDVFIGLGIGLILAYLGYIILNKNSKKAGEDITNTVLEKLSAKMPEFMNQLATVANKELKHEGEKTEKSLEHKRGEIERLIKVMQQDLKESKNALNSAEKERVGSYEALKTELEKQSKRTEDLKVSTDSLKNLLSNNQLRGQFGEQVAEELLQMTGFVKGKHYEFNKEQAGSETRPDFSVFMPDGKRINVDAKFPYSNLQKMSETDSKEEKRRFKQLFEQDVKSKIKQVTTRDYINPEDNTVDFVILFIPNEMIFSFIYDQFNDVWKEAMEKKVVFAGPFSFTAILRMVYQSYNNFRVQENFHSIIKNIGTLEQEFEKFSTEYVKVGKKISELTNQYEKVGTTRFNKITRTMEKIRLEGDSSEEPKEEQVKLVE